MQGRVAVLHPLCRSRVVKRADGLCRRTKRGVVRVDDDLRDDRRHLPRHALRKMCIRDRINFPLWMASLAVVCPELLGVLTGLRFGWGAKLLIELAFIWIVTWIACYPVCDSILILNISAAIKMLLALTVGVLGIVYVARSGFVNDMAPRTFLPGFDLHSLSYISVIIFNFLGFEVVCTYADNMRDPKPVSYTHLQRRRAAPARQMV